jgi:hypothetical protein
MSDIEKRRKTAVLLGALAVGAVLSGALGAKTGDASISDQFSSAFTPGAVRDVICGPIVVE